jgi:hypothetical protein
MFRVWLWLLVGIPHPYDRNDPVLFLHDEEVRDELLDGVLQEGYTQSL